MTRAWAGLAVVVAAGSLLGCGSKDRTVGHIRLLNDTRRAVILGLCDDESCHGSLHGPATVAPGKGGVVPVSTVGVPNVYLVRLAATGGRDGCLPLVMPHYVEGLVARVSQAVPCRDRYDHHVQWPAAGS